MFGHQCMKDEQGEKLSAHVGGILAEFILPVLGDQLSQLMLAGQLMALQRVGV